MAAKPYYTSADLIEAVKRKISFPIYQNTFTEDDILRFANEEMFLSQVPSILLYHEEYFVAVKRYPMQSNVSRYPIPSRAIGMRLRDLNWQDAYGNLFEMTRVSSDDKAFFQRNIGANQAIHKFYLEGNDVVLTPAVVSNPTGMMNFYYFQRPNQLVHDSRAALISNFQQNITVDNTTLVPGDEITINGVAFVAVTSGATGTQFNIGVTSIDTATNLAAAINTANIKVIAGNTSSTSNVVNLTFTDINIAVTISDPLLYYQVQSAIVTSNQSALNVPSTLVINFQSIPTIFTTGAIIDFLETNAGHRIKGIDVQVQNVSGMSMTFNITDIPTNLSSDDYVCLANECIIPNIPSDLHNGLAERTCARILAAIGDQQGLAATQSKIQEIEQRQGTLLDARVEGAPKKITARHSLMRFGKQGVRRRV